MRLINVDRITEEEICKYLGAKYASCCEEVMEMLKEQPTAFYEERVLETLRKELELADREKGRCSRENILQFDEAKGYARGISYALEVAIGGRIG